jgi:hypothetical protein
MRARILTTAVACPECPVAVWPSVVYATTEISASATT